MQGLKIAPSLSRFTEEANSGSVRSKSLEMEGVSRNMLFSNGLSRFLKGGYVPAFRGFDHVRVSDRDPCLNTRRD